MVFGLFLRQFIGSFVRVFCVFVLCNISHFVI